MLKIFLIFLLALSNTQLWAQTDQPKEEKKYHEKTWNLTDEQRVNYTTWGIVTIPLVVTVYGSLTWDWGKDAVNFGTGTEGWFERDTYTGGADKFGHMNSMYIQKRFTTFIFERMGWNRDQANLLGVLTASLVGIGFEVGDGISKYKASGNDIVVDAIGIGLAYLTDKYPQFDEIFGITWQYWPSKEYRSPRNPDQKDIMSDYNGMKFMGTLRASGIPYLQDHIYTRYLNLDVGYYSRGYAPDITPENKTDGERFRHAYVGLSLNLWKAFIDPSPTTTWNQRAGQLFKYYQPPVAAIDLARTTWR